MRTREPWWWRPLSIISASVGVAFTITVMYVGVHFALKYW